MIRRIKQFWADHYHTIGVMAIATATLAAMFWPLLRMHWENF